MYTNQNIKTILKMFDLRVNFQIKATLKLRNEI